jgi:3-oxoacyl-[acyl-carrier protein] reductase
MTELRFEGRAAVITGAGEGIGREIARRLVLEGARVLLNDADGARAEAAARALSAEGGVCRARPGDVAEEGVVSSLVAEALRAFGRLDIAVANAGVTLFGDFFEYRVADFDRLLAVNLKGSFFLAQAAAREMRARGGGGRILLLSSVTGHLAIRSLAAYGLSKAALEMMARVLVPELSPHGITINAIAPGATVTPRTLAEDPEYVAAWSKATPLGRPASVEDVAGAALFLLSPAAGHVTGQSLVIDGGWTSVGNAPPSGPGGRRDPEPRA